jgi:hypothetical protein
MKRISILLFPLVAVGLFSCQEDADRTIRTDLVQEAKQFLSISEAWGESLFFAMNSFNFYQGIASDSLPGCPEISVNNTEGTVILNFNSGCEAGESARSGKIILQFPVSGYIQTTWSLAYEGYSYRGWKIEGTRSFTFTSLQNIREEFDGLSITTSNELNSTLSGSFNHRQVLRAFSFSEVVTSGSMEGLNPSGRRVQMHLQADRIADYSCFLSSESRMPRSAEELWEVTRESEIVKHSLTYTPLDSCQTQVDALLPDGRTLQLRP